MSNRREQQFHFSLVPRLTSRIGSFVIGASGAVSSYDGNGVYAVTKLHAGIYQVTMQDNFNAFLMATFLAESPTTGSPVADGSLVTGTLYQITVVGTTNWANVGVPAGITPVIGVPFVATGAGGAGTGTATAVGITGIDKVELAQGAQVQLIDSTVGQGSIFIIQTLAATNSSTTTLIPTNPNQNTRIRFEFMFRNSILSA